jgi:hypothetical protein
MRLVRKGEERESQSVANYRAGMEGSLSLDYLVEDIGHEHGHGRRELQQCSDAAIAIAILQLSFLGRSGRL